LSKISNTELIKKKKIETKTFGLKFGKFGLKACEGGVLSVKQFEILKLKLKQGFKRKGKLWFRKLPYISVSKKPGEVRMGKGKGAHLTYIVPIKIAQVFIEFSISRKRSFLEVLKLVDKCRKKIGFKTVLFSRRGFINYFLKKKFNKISNKKF